MNLYVYQVMMNQTQQMNTWKYLDKFMDLAYRKRDLEYLARAAKDNRDIEMLARIGRRYSLINSLLEKFN